MITRAAPGVIAASLRRTAGGGSVVLGYDTKGTATSFSLAFGRMLVSKFTLASAKTLNELHGWFGQSGTTSAIVRVVVYDDDGGSGLPGTRLAYTNQFTYS